MQVLPSAERDRQREQGGDSMRQLMSFSLHIFFRGGERSS
jgi:hypothetical protein